MKMAKFANVVECNVLCEIEVVSDLETGNLRLPRVEARISCHLRYFWRSIRRCKFHSCRKIVV